MAPLFSECRNGVDMDGDLSSLAFCSPTHFPSTFSYSVASRSSLCPAMPSRRPRAAPTYQAATSRSLSTRPTTMSLSTPTPPAAHQPSRSSRPGDSSSGRGKFVTELTSAAELEEAVEAARNETYSTVDATGNYVERPMLVIVEAYSRSCRACIGFRRIYEKLAEEHALEVRCFKFDAFQVHELSKKLGLRAIPTFVVYKKGERVDHFSAAKREAFETHLLDNM